MLRSAAASDMIISAAKAQEAAKELGVELEGLNPDSLSKAYRTLSREHHPDVARDLYNPEKWARISWAKEVLVRWLERAVVEASKEIPKGDCRACGGAGRITVKRAGFGKPMTLQCVMCQGTGDVTLGGQRGHYGRSE